MEPIMGRQYKSRKLRPCDLCRKRKVACHMESSPPCEMCRQKDHPCTFTRGPGPRTRPNHFTTIQGSTSGHIHDVGVRSPPQVGDERTSSREASGTVLAASSHGDQAMPDATPHIAINQNLDDMLDMFMRGADRFDYFNTSAGLAEMADMARTAANIRPSSPTASQVTRSLTSPSINSHPSPHPLFDSCGSLERLSGSSSRFIGFTGELDLYLLRHRQYDLNDQSSSQYTNIVYRRMNRLSTLIDPSLSPEHSLPPQVFTIMDDLHTDKAEPRMGTSVMEHNSFELRSLISDEVANGLIRLFYRFINPYFPVLSKAQFPQEQPSNMPTSLLAAICASAIPFIIYDDELCVQLPKAPSVTQLFRICWLAIIQELHTPRLSTIQACLLMLQRHATDLYVADSPFKWTLASITVAVAQNLGLNRDPREWVSLPLWERKLRRRLWWALWVMETWTALGNGMPTHLHESDYDVEILTDDDLEGEPMLSRGSLEVQSHFNHLMRLTIILRGIVNTYYTVRGVKITASDFNLSLDLAKSARAKLKDWHDKLPTNLRTRKRASTMAIIREESSDSADYHGLDGNCALHLAYIVTQMTLFRALLRPISNWKTFLTDFKTQAEFEGANAVITGAMTCIKELVEFIESLTGTDWDAFWHSWSRHNFAIASTFLMQLLFIVRTGQSPKSNIQQPQDPLDMINELAMKDHYESLQGLVKRWRWAMRVSARGAGGNKGLMNLSLLRIDALFTEWQKGTAYGDQFI